MKRHLLTTALTGSMLVATFGAAAAATGAVVGISAKASATATSTVQLAGGFKGSPRTSGSSAGSSGGRPPSPTARGPAGGVPLPGMAGTPFRGPAAGGPTGAPIRSPAASAPFRGPTSGPAGSGSPAAAASSGGPGGYTTPPPPPAARPGRAPNFSVGGSGVPAAVPRPVSRTNNPASTAAGNPAGASGFTPPAPASRNGGNPGAAPARPVARGGNGGFDPMRRPIPTPGDSSTASTTANPVPPPSPRGQNPPPNVAGTQQPGGPAASRPRIQRLPSPQELARQRTLPTPGDSSTASTTANPVAAPRPLGQRGYEQPGSSLDGSGGRLSGIAPRQQPTGPRRLPNPVGGGAYEQPGSSLDGSGGRLSGVAPRQQTPGTRRLPLPDANDNTYDVVDGMVDADGQPVSPIEQLAQQGVIRAGRGRNGIEGFYDGDGFQVGYDPNSGTLIRVPNGDRIDPWRGQANANNALLQRRGLPTSGQPGVAYGSLSAVDNPQGPGNFNAGRNQGVVPRYTNPLSGTANPAGPQQPRRPRTLPAQQAMQTAIDRNLARQPAQLNRTPRTRQDVAAAMVQGGRIKAQQVDGKWYYFDNNGFAVDINPQTMALVPVPGPRIQPWQLPRAGQQAATGAQGQQGGNAPRSLPPPQN